MGSECLLRTGAPAVASWVDGPKERWSVVELV